MITAEETRRLAWMQGLAAGVLEKDYALAWLLSGIYHEDSKLREVLIFKGGQEGKLTAVRLKEEAKNVSGIPAEDFFYFCSHTIEPCTHKNQRLS